MAQSRLRKSTVSRKSIGKVVKTGKKKTLGSMSSPETKAVRAALTRLEKASQALSARGAELMALAHHLGDAAVRRHMDALVQELADKHFLRDILSLRDTFAAAVTDRSHLPGELERLRTVPEALVLWFAERLELTPHMTAGQELEVEASRLSSYLFDGDPPENLDGLVKMRVLTPGWKRAGKALIPPYIEFVEAPKR